MERWMWAVGGVLVGTWTAVVLTDVVLLVAGVEVPSGIHQLAFACLGATTATLIVAIAARQVIRHINSAAADVDRQIQREGAVLRADLGRDLAKAVESVIGAVYEEGFRQGHAQAQANGRVHRIPR